MVSACRRRFCSRWISRRNCSTSPARGLRGTGFLPRLRGARPAISPNSRCLRQVVMWDEYKPSRRISAAIPPSPHWSASCKMFRLYLAEKRLRIALLSTSGLATRGTLPAGAAAGMVAPPFREVSLRSPSLHSGATIPISLFNSAIPILDFLPTLYIKLTRGRCLTIIGTEGCENDADWGVKTYRGKGKDGAAWEKIVRWFGFELHLLVDATHELPVNYRLTKASAAESPLLLPIVEQTKELHPKVIENCEELSGDKGYDSAKNNKDLYDLHKIHPIIDKRSDWKDTTDTTRPMFPDRADTVVYDVKGRICCVCPKTGEMRSMAPWGFEPDRGTLKYRCPAAAFGFECKGKNQCPGAQTPYGKIVRIPIETDRRMFTPVARDTAAWERAYDRRTAVERVNSRIDRVLGFEQHTIRGLNKMDARVGIALIVLLSIALGRIQVGQREQMRSLLAPVARAA